MKPLNIENLEKMVAERYIRREKHPTADLYIYNYTEKTQYDRMWNNETLQCRGLILDGQYNVVARPFPKFFNYEEVGGTYVDDMVGDFTVTEKMDGSLGILYWDPTLERPQIATRGSFVSDQAKRANKRLETYLISQSVWYNPAYTYLFEIIYPENRIVVDYGGLEDIILLAVVETSTGEELLHIDIAAQFYNHFKIVKQYEGITDFDNIVEHPNAEGYVVHFPKTGLRFKIKFEEYKRLHKIITGVNKKRVWEFLSSGQSLDDLDELLVRVPDEFYDWITKTAKELQNEYNRIEGAAVAITANAEGLYHTRKEQAQYILSQEGVKSSVVFAMLDNKPYEQIIWKLIEPPFERPFKVEV